MQSAINNQPPSKIFDRPKLDQNIPNPFNGSSSINYYIPSGFHNAQLLVTDITGRILKTYSVAQSDYGKQITYGSEINKRNISIFFID